MEVTAKDIKAYLESVEEKRKDDVLKLIELGKKITNKEPVMWGSMIGFGKVHYRYKTGHEGHMFLFGFANRKQALTLYMSYDINQFEELNVLGKHKTGQGCLYIKKLSDVDLEVLEKLIIKATNQLLNSDIITLID
ncbi:hypothetical protein BK011_02875 [Tenericutes bacterium MZ-XQ]|jgi:hypothetical protein|nr:hypothetical protein BK011_02875 [Tenericutes bacterium MZ-XQ]